MADSAKDCVVIGSGPNGLAAAVTLARAGHRVTVHEANETIGGGARSEELTLPGFVHDVCSAVHPMGGSSPCFEEFALGEHGLKWAQPDAPLAHPFDDGSAAMLERSIEATAAGLGPDGDAWRRLFRPLVADWPELRHDVLAPLLRIPRHPVALTRFGLRALQPAVFLARETFAGMRARALFAGSAAHAIMPLEAPASASIGLVMTAIGHASGWPVARGGSQKISDALAGRLRSLGGEVRTGSRVERLPKADLVMCDVSPRQLLALGGDAWPAGYRRALARFRQGPGVFKVDWALDGPIPWAAPECARSATVHLGGTMEEIAAWEREHVGRPFVILTQPSLFDETRAPAGQHTAWGYCHVPNGSGADMTEAIEAQVERFAPGFRGRVLARRSMGPAELEMRNANLIGGDIGGGEMSLRQVVLRPTARAYRTPLAGVFLCSASTPPGGGVHGMCGYHAARAALGG